MNAAETIQAAIDRLTKLREASRGEGPKAGSLSPDAADLVVTLHRTIDAQLAILRADLALHELGFRDGDPGSWRNAVLDLARAILGGAK